MEINLKKRYSEQVIPALKEKCGFANITEVPKIVKVVVQSHVGKEADRKQAVADATDEIAKITGQKPVQIVAKRSVSNFKVREGEVVGAKVTLRGKTMYEFLQRLMFTAIPSIRDFRGVSYKAFDGRGNYTLGITEQSIFPEVELDKIKRNLGFDVNIVTTATTDDHARMLLTEMGMPFRKPPTKTPDDDAASEEAAA